MDLINHQYIVEEENKENVSVTYLIEIGDFRRKMIKARVGEMVESKTFHVNWSKFSVLVYIAGKKEDSRGHISLYVRNESQS